MKREVILRVVIVMMVLLFGLGACSIAPKIVPLGPGESCLQKFVGTWEGYVQAPNAMWWNGGAGRTLILFEKNGQLAGRFGARSLGLLNINPEVKYHNEGCTATIRFMAAPGIDSNRVELNFVQDGYFQGYFNIPAIFPITFNLRKQE